MNSHRKYFKSQ